MKSWILTVLLIVTGSVAQAKVVECTRSQALNLVKASQTRLYSDYLEMTHQRDEDVISFNDFKKASEALGARCSDEECRTHGFSSAAFAEHACQHFLMCRFYVDVESCGPKDKAELFFEIDPE